MDVENVSDESSVFHFSSDSLLSIRACKNKYNDFAAQKKCSTKRNGSPSKNIEQTKQLSRGDRLRSMGVFNPRTDKCSLLPKANDASNKNNSLKLSSQKMKLAARPMSRIGSSSKKPEFLGFPSFSMTNSRQSQNRNKENNFGSDKAIGSGSKRNVKEMIEIEVFMPVVDSKRNKITYPKNKRPIVKRYSVTEGHFLRPNDHFDFNKRNRQTNLKKTFLQQKPKNATSGALNKNISKLPQITVKINDCDKSVTGRSISSTKHVNSSVNGKEFSEVKTASEIQEHFSDIALGIEVQNGKRSPAYHRSNASHHGVSNENENGGVAMCSKADILPRVPKRKLENKNENSSTQNEIISEANFRLSEENISNRQNNITEGYRKALKNSSGSGSDIFIGAIHKRRTKNTIVKGLYSCFAPIKKDINSYNGLYEDKIDLKRQDLSTLTYQLSRKCKSDENGWRRNSPRKTFSSCSTTNSWRKDTKGLVDVSMESWLDRSRYLLTRNQQLQDRSHHNNWRAG